MNVIIVTRNACLEIRHEPAIFQVPWAKPEHEIIIYMYNVVYQVVDGDFNLLASSILQH